MRFRNLIFPFSLALILGGVSAWLERISTVSVEEVKLDPTKPQYIMTGMLAHRFDVSGSLKEELLADKSWQLPTNRMYICNMRICIHFSMINHNIP